MNRVKAIYWIIAACGATAAALVLSFFAPDQHAFYPRCLFHAVTGLQCPGCGGLRAAPRLLHADLAGAWRFNPFLGVAVPPLAVLFSVDLFYRHGGGGEPRFVLGSTWGGGS